MSTKQLYEKTSEGMKEVSPLVYIEDIYSKFSDTPLEALVSLFNHVKCEWKGSVADTRRTVPLFLRRSGLFITYNNGTKFITEFFSAGADQITTEGWVKDSNWTSVPDEDYISAGVKPGVGSIGYEQLNGVCLYNEEIKKVVYSYNGSWVDALGNNALAKYNGTTQQRPTEINLGFQYFDTTLNKPIWWTGEKWVDATGADV